MVSSWHAQLFQSENNMPHEDHISLNLLGSLLQLSITVNGSQDPAEILARVADFTRKLVRSDTASVVLWDADKTRLELGAVSHPDQATNGHVSYTAAARWIVERGKPVIVSDTGQDPFDLCQEGEGRARAYLGVPLKRATEPLGALFAVSDQPRAFDQGELVTMEAVAAVAAVAIHNAQLMRALRQVNELKQTLIQLAAHDIRNPLTKALGFLSLLVEDLPDPNPSQSNFLNSIERALYQIEEIIEGILAHERAATGELDRQPCDLNQIARQAVADFETAAAQKSQHVTFQPDADPAVVAGDAVLLREAVGNLISNAVKYTPPEGEIIVQTGTGADEVVITIQDSGPGISPDDQQEIFRPFTRLRSAGAERGSGLGLSLVKTVVERHGGRVTVDSTIGQGAIFGIHLPVDRLPG
jgi:signal transduction histidine kinase